MSEWKSRWSCVRLVNAATSKRIPSARLRVSACEEISVDHAAEGGLEVDRLRRRALDRLDLPADHTLDRAQEPGPDALALEDVADEEGRRRLAVRAGDPDHVEVVGGVAVEAHRRVGHCSARVRDPRLDDVRLELEWALDDDRGGAGLDGVGC